MRTLDELRSPESAWPQVQAWIRAAKVSVTVLPTTPAQAESVLLALQVTTRSPMGALALETGGLVLDGGWLRFLGGGGPTVRADLARWSGLLGSSPLRPPPHGFQVVAHDVLGGFFALDGGGLGPGDGSVFYFAPDTLEWESLGFGYSAFLAASLTDLLPALYAESRWPGWQVEVAGLSADQGLSIYPPLWSKEAGAIAKTSRRPASMIELWAMEQDLADQMTDLPDGETVETKPKA